MPASLMGACLRRLCTIPISPKVTEEGEQRSLWYPSEKVDMARQLCHSILLLLKADGDEGELTGTYCSAGGPQDPSQHEDEKQFVAPTC